MSIFHGLSAFPITPADAQGVVLTDDLARLLLRIRDGGTQSVGLLGSTGIYAYLSRTERRRAVEAASQALQGTLPLIVGVGALRTDQAVELARDAEQAGADGLLLAPMSYTPLTAAEVLAHFQAVAGATDLPLCIYNNPSTTHFNFDLPLIERIAAIPTIAALKMPLPADGDFTAEIARLRAALPDRVAIGYSGDWACAEALLAGADAWFSVAGGLFPAASARLSAAAIAGQQDAAQALDAELAPLWSLFREFGSLRVVYMAANLLGLTEAQPPRPVRPLPADQRDRVAAAIAGLAG